jgi:hypothetical protein
MELIEDENNDVRTYECLSNVPSRGRVCARFRNVAPCETSNRKARGSEALCVRQVQVLTDVRHQKRSHIYHENHVDNVGRVVVECQS